MSYTTKRKLMNSSVYIVLGLVITAVLCVAVATFAGMKDKKKPVVSDTPPTQTSATKNSNAPVNKPPVKTPSPSKNQTPIPSDGKNSDKSVIDPVRPVIYLPAEGGIQKAYSPAQPVYSLTMNDYRTHTGIDISAPVGSAVVSIADGTICDIYNDPMMGMCLAIDHGEGLISTYKNLSSTLPEGIAKGIEVKAGQVVAAVGDTSLVELAEADHLHFELTLNGKYTDPAGYLDLSLLTTDKGVD